MPVRTLASIVALGLIVSVAAVAVPAAAAADAAAACTGVNLGGFTGFCTNDPNCPSPSPTGSGTGYYVRGVLMACSLN